MAKGSRVLIIERLILDDPADALLSDMTILVVTGGQERTNAEYAQLLAQAGLNLTNIQPITLPTASSRASHSKRALAAPDLDRRMKRAQCLGCLCHEECHLRIHARPLVVASDATLPSAGSALTV